jgi:hypothetical protein
VWDSAAPVASSGRAVLISRFQTQQAGLLESLQALVTNTADLPTQTSLGCLLLAVDQVAELLTGGRSAESEPNERGLLSEQLDSLGFDQIGASSIPACSDEQILQTLLQHLAHPDLIGVSGSVMQSPAQRPNAESVSRPVAPAASADPGDWNPQQELEALEIALERAVSAGQISRHDQAGFASRICAVRQRAEGDEPAAAWRDEVEGLRKRLRERGAFAAPASRIAPNADLPNSEASAPVGEADSVLLDD